ncbi:MAG: ABC transporter permease [Actinomycetia bacterium]|nr:ABC transporter permease [Actinomycetes bacterium]
MDGIRSWFEFVFDRWDEIVEASLQHAQITLTVIAFATVFSVAIGIFVHQRPTARAAALSIAGVFLTIPSLALFALFIPLVGIGNKPAMIALFLYALLPILRNTVTGLDEVNPAVVESAKGMGLNSWQQLVRVRMPLAWPVIMAGIRVSSLLVVGIAAIAVLVGGDGLGTFIQKGLTRLGLPNSIESVWVGTVFTVLLGLLLDVVFSTIQRLTTSRGLRL